MNKQELINFENEIADLYRDCKLPFLFHLSGGNEDQLIEIFKEIKEGDYVLSTHRNHYHALLHGIPPETLKERILNGRSMFIFDRKRNFFTSAIIGGTPAIAAGIALALKKKGSKQKVWCFVGDGIEDTGHLWEAARYVDGHELPCTFVIEDNNRSVETTKEERWGKATKPQFPSCVRRYEYEITWPHARTTDMIDISRQKKFTDEDCFPSLKVEELDFEAFKGDISYKIGASVSMEHMAENNAVFIGYNVKNGNAMGTLKNVPDELKIETPVAENLMVGLGIGMSFEGYRPVVYFERHDFMLVAADAIGNHLNHIERTSHGEYQCPVVLKTVIADSGPFYSGPTHSQDFTEVFEKLVNFPVVVPDNGKELIDAYQWAAKSSRPTMIVEKKSLY
jgi:pyruvate dehydrogenase E1 component alpha subunit